MQNKRVGTLKGLTANIGQFESIAEAVAAAGGKEEMVLNEINSNLVYRGPLDDVRDLISELVEEESGIERLTKDTGRKDKDGNPVIVYDEPAGKYVDRVCAQKKWDDLKAFQDKLDAAVAAQNEGKGLNVDISVKERKSSLPVKLKAEYINTATRILQSGDFSKVNAAFTQYNITLPTMSGDGAKDIDTLARAIKSLQEARAKDALNNL